MGYSIVDDDGALERLNEIEQKSVAAAVDAVCISAKLGKRSVAIRFVDDESMRRYNWIYRRKNKTTDVLSFATADGPALPMQALYLGDLLISIETAQKQALVCEHSIDCEVAVLVAHGLLHLLGLDHERSADEALMQAECEMTLLDAAGFIPASALIGRTLGVSTSMDAV